MVCVTKEQCVFFVLISVTQVSGLTTFISPYNGTTLKGTVKSSLQFNWAFSVEFGTIEWGFALAAHSKVLSDDGILFTIYADGTTQATTSAPYAGRVSGSVIRQGLVGFTLRNLRTSDARYFGCRISPLDVFLKKETDTVKLIVEDKPNITHPREASKSFIEGNHVNISCTGIGKVDPGVQWSHDGRVVSSGSGTAYLSFSDIKRSDEGIYTCRANNTAGITEKQVNVTVNYPAYIEKVSPPSPHESWIAHNVTFVCKANGVPTPTITWKGPNRAEIKRVVGSENVLRLLMQKDGDFGSYLCEADNTVGSVDKHTVQVDQISLSYQKDMLPQ